MRKKKKGFFLLGCALIFSGIAVHAEEKKELLRAVIFYQEDTWIQDINIMNQIAQSIQKKSGRSS